MKRQKLFFIFKCLTILTTGWLLWNNPFVLLNSLPFTSNTKPKDQSIQFENTVDQLLNQSLSEEDLAKGIAYSLNDHWSMAELNHLFLEQLNMKRYDEGFASVEVDETLKEGAESYAQDLIDYHYLASTTPEGEDFRSYFPWIDEAPYRLSSYLYELNIPIRDIRLSTWQTHPEVLTSFLVDQWESNIQPEVLGQYMMLKVEEEWNEQHAEFYIRMVGVLITDTGHVQYD